MSQAGIPTKPIASPKDVYALDGQLLAQVVHQTVSFTFILSGNHRKTLQF